MPAATVGGNRDERQNIEESSVMSAMKKTRYSKKATLNWRLKAAGGAHKAASSCETSATSAGFS